MNTGPRGSDSQVQGTNDSSIVSKLSMILQGYFEDKCLHYFVDVPRRRSPLINHGYYLRATIMDYKIKHFFKLIDSKHSQVISLGAGFDSSFFRLIHSKYLPANCLYVEIDFPAVVKRKENIIRKHPELQQCIKGNINLSDDQTVILSTNYVLIGADLRDLKNLSDVLNRVGIKDNVPTLLMSECAITYLDERSSSSLIHWASQSFTRAVFATYEQINPLDGFGIVMQNHFVTVGSPLLTLPAYPSCQTQQERYLKQGWEDCTATPAFDLWMHITTEEERLRVLRLEPFDEFEEFDAKSSHYALVWAVQGLNGKMNKVPSIMLHIDCLPVLHYELKPSTLRRYSHTCVTINTLCVVIGGFGSLNKKSHSRVKQLVSVDYTSGVLQEIDCSSQHLSRMKSTAVALESDNRILLLFGRYSPTTPCESLLSIQVNTQNGTVQWVCEVVEVGNSPCGRWRHSSTLVNKPNNHMAVVVVGGRTVDSTVLSDCWELCTSLSLPWQQIPSLPIPSHSHSTCTWKKDDLDFSIVLSGGLSTNTRLQNKIWLMDSQYSDWCELKTYGYIPRYSHTAHTIGNKMVLVGGVNPWCQDYVIGCSVVDLCTGVCQEYALPQCDPRQPILLFNHTSLVEDGKIIVIGGGGNCFSFGTHFNTASIHVPLHSLNIQE